ncbi:TetR/AcrR family transcriptional regulator [Streptomyces sp. NPDC006368]|uniref:TetR/AcrR family transcriptional regulator n=1 Tax=Streptomyces sp. NPDC006368 TaxID=3156760 RepID=UPI0033A8A9F7
MPTAREALLDAALAALAELPWPAVRMVDVAAAAGVSRQTLYNEFGSKQGLARALIRREAEAYLDGVERLLDARDAGDRLPRVAEWIVARARDRPILRALLTDCWGDRLPAPHPVRPHRTDRPVGRGGLGTPGPGELVAAVRDRLLTGLDGGGGGGGGGGSRAADGAWVCELVVRLALSYVVAPQCEEPDSWSPITPTMTSVIETIFSVDTTSPRKTIP